MMLFGFTVLAADSPTKSVSLLGIWRAFKAYGGRPGSHGAYVAEPVACFVWLESVGVACDDESWFKNEMTKIPGLSHE